MNDALEGAVPGPKLNLIKGSYHILRETAIPGTITESGFMTNKDFDELSSRPDYPKKEAAAIVKGASKYWTTHKVALVALREKLTKERAAKPRDPKTYTAIALNPDHKTGTDRLLAQVAPGGKYDPTKVGEYVEAFRKAVVTDPKATFTVKAAFDGERIKLTGEASDRKYHDQLIDMFVAMNYTPSPTTSGCRRRATDAVCRSYRATRPRGGISADPRREVWKDQHPQSLRPRPNHSG